MLGQSQLSLGNARLVLVVVDVFCAASLIIMGRDI